MELNPLPIGHGELCSGLRTSVRKEDGGWKSLAGCGFLPFLAITILFLSPGCRKPAERGPSTSSLLEDLGRLPGLRRSAHPGLKEELARIEEERGTPEQLTVPLPPAEENLAGVLVDLFPAERVEFLVGQTADWLQLFPDRFKAEDRKAAEELVKSLQPQRATVRAGLMRPKCVFPIRFTAGFGANLGFVDQCILAVQVEEIAAVLGLSEANLTSAIDALEVAFRLCGVLSRAKHPQLRWQAAILREQALQWLQLAVSHPAITRDELGRLANILQKELAIWPSDADAWIGARALGMHAYELIRIGRLYDVLTEREIKQLRQAYDLEELARIAQERADEDELFYLTQMRKIIALCQKPYYQRVEELETLQAMWESKAREEEAIVASRVLLPEVPAGQKIQAQDLANVQAWVVALRAARDEGPGEDVVNPLTGSPYIVEVQNDTIFVSGIGTDLGRHGAIEVPRRPPPKTATSEERVDR
ncbi:MAG: hypothetical protein ACUVQG_01590 [Thermogutta sp.]